MGSNKSIDYYLFVIQSKGGCLMI